MDLRQVVADEQDGHTLVAHRTHELADLGLLLHAEGRRRFVHEQHLGPPCHRTSDRYGLALATGQPAGECFHGADPDAGPLQVGFGLTGHRLAVEPADQAQRAVDGLFAPEEDVRPHRKVRGEGEILVDRFDPGAAGLERGAERHLLAVHEHGPGVGLERARKDVDQSGLPCAVVAHEP